MPEHLNVVWLIITILGFAIILKNYLSFALAIKKEPLKKSTAGIVPLWGGILTALGLSFYFKSAWFIPVLFLDLSILLFVFVVIIAFKRRHKVLSKKAS